MALRHGLKRDMQTEDVLGTLVEEVCCPFSGHGASGGDHVLVLGKC